MRFPALVPRSPPLWSPASLIRRLSDLGGILMPKVRRFCASDCGLDARERHLWPVRKGGVLGGLDFDQWGTASLPTPPPTLNPAGAQELTTSSGCTSFARSYWRKRAAVSRLFARKRGCVTLLALKPGDRGSFREGGWSGTNSGGTLTVTDGMDTANIALLDQYMAASFVTSPDGSGGTLVQDPPPATLAQTLTQPQNA